FARHQQQRLPLTRPQRHANSYLLAPLRDRVARDPGESDCGQHQAEHPNAAVCNVSEPGAGPDELQVLTERSHIEDGQVRIDGGDLAPNAAQRIRSRAHSCIRPHHNGHAIGRWPRKIAPRQRHINYGSADPDVIPQVADHADYFIGLLVVPKELPYRISISEKSSRGALVQYGGEGARHVWPVSFFVGSRLSPRPPPLAPPAPIHPRPPLSAPRHLTPTALLTAS